MTLTEAGWKEIKQIMDEWKNNPESNYSDKERFFKDWWEAFFEEMALQGNNNNDPR